MTMAAALMLLFVFALGLSLALTPLVRALGIRLGAMDIPMERKVHKQPIPRIGGVAVFFSLVITTLLANNFLPRV
jgi:UDP-GlcNAc:undecaprenyl-phosphate/decaprenyl-phosphate GlcNAc-1-phosphate transferase